MHDLPLGPAAHRPRNLERRTTCIVARDSPINQNPVLRFDAVNMTREVTHPRLVYACGWPVVTGQCLGDGEEIPLELLRDRCCLFVRAQRARQSDMRDPLVNGALFLDARGAG